MEPAADDPAETTLAEAPFVAALGPELSRVPPLVRQHLSLGTGLHVGTVKRLWRRGLFGHMVGRFLHLHAPKGAAVDIRFKLENELVRAPGGTTAMTWRRTAFTDEDSVTGVGLVRWDAARGALVDAIGRWKLLEVELIPSVEGDAVVMRSGRQCLRISGLRIPLPRWLFGHAVAREWEEGERIGLSLSIHHALFGACAGYEVVLSPRGGA